MPTTYDMSDYLCNDTASQGLTGTHFLKALKHNDSTAYVMKSATGSPFEQYDITADSIYLRFESGCALNAQCWGISDGNPDSFRFWPIGGYKWCPRIVHDGMIYNTGSCQEYYHWTDSAGEHKKSVPLSDYPCVVNILKDVPLGGNIGVRPTLVALSHFWKTNTIDPGNREVYYYDKWLGLVIWEDWNGGVVTARSLFNVEILTDAVPPAVNIPDIAGFSPCGG